MSPADRATVNSLRQQAAELEKAASLLLAVLANADLVTATQRSDAEWRFNYARDGMRRLLKEDQ